MIFVWNVAFSVLTFYQFKETWKERKPSISQQKEKLSRHDLSEKKLKFISVIFMSGIVDIDAFNA